MTTRRRFLQVGIAGTAALLAVAALERASSVGPRNGRFPGEEDARIVRALAAVVLAGALPSPGADRDAALHRVVDGFKRAAAALDPDAREELARLLGLLRFGPSRVALAGLWRSVDEADERALGAFLARWRTSRFDLLRAAYAALTQLLLAAWYADAEAWPRTGYPGPPPLEARREA